MCLCLRLCTEQFYAIWAETPAKTDYHHFAYSTTVVNSPILLLLIPLQKHKHTPKTHTLHHLRSARCSKSNHKRRNVWGSGPPVFSDANGLSFAFICCPPHYVIKTEAFCGKYSNYLHLPVRCHRLCLWLLLPLTSPFPHQLPFCLYQFYSTVGYIFFFSVYCSIALRLH